MYRYLTELLLNILANVLAEILLRLLDWLHLTPWL
jgi:hypothetical protein